MGAGLVLVEPVLFNSLKISQYYHSVNPIVSTMITYTAIYDWHCNLQVGSLQYSSFAV